MMPSSSPTPPGILATIAAVFRQNRVPCLFLNVVVVALVWSYYRWPAVAGIWEMLGEFKTRWSFGFSLVSTQRPVAPHPCLKWLNISHRERGDVSLLSE